MFFAIFKDLESFWDCEFLVFDSSVFKECKQELNWLKISVSLIVEISDLWIHSQAPNSLLNFRSSWALKSTISNRIISNNQHVSSLHYILIRDFYLQYQKTFYVSKTDATFSQYLHIFWCLLFTYKRSFKISIYARINSKVFVLFLSKQKKNPCKLN